MWTGLYNTNTEKSERKPVFYGIFELEPRSIIVVMVLQVSFVLSESLN